MYGLTQTFNLSKELHHNNDFNNKKTILSQLFTKPTQLRIQF